MIKFKKITFDILVWLIFINIVSSCYGEGLKKKIDTKEFPIYFSTEAWDTIKLANDQYDRGTKKIIAIMDSPVKYVAGLDGKNYNTVQVLINNGTNVSYSYLDHPYHGTAVAGLIASKPYKLSCDVETKKGFSSKSCDKPEIVISGIAQHTNLINAPEASIKNLVTNMELLSDEEKKNIRTSRKQIPVKAILNFFIGPTKDKMAIKKEYLQNVKKEYEKKQSSVNKNSDDYLLLQWIIEYIDNDMQWVMPPSPALILNNKWHSMQNYRDMAQNNIEQELQKLYDTLKNYKDALVKYILPNKDSFLVIVAAGNDGKQLYRNNAGFLLGKTTLDDDPIIVVAAGCGKEYGELCSFSNYGKEFVDILAPGEHIPVILSLETANGVFVPKTTYTSGTSFSAPLVAGTAALLAQCNPTASTADIKKVILESAHDDPTLETKIAGGKVLDVKKAIDYMCKTDVDSYSEKPKETEDMNMHNEL